MLSLPRILPEILIAGASLLVMLLLSVALDLPLIVPSGERASFVGIHYIYPLIGIAILGLVTFFVGRRDVAIRFMIALPCYVAILFAHFNIKLWIPHINHLNFDNNYWWVEKNLAFLVKAFMFIGKEAFFFIPYKANFYMISFIVMFYISFCYHAIKTPEIFGRVITGVLLLQAFGTLAYLVAPAIGPFIYEAGLNPIITGGQASMLDFYQDSIANGPQWLAVHGGPNFTAGLAAMPSLHSASAFLFFLFAFHHGRILLPLYSFILFYIIIMAVASRWHYLVDLPAGMLIAWISYKLADYLERKPALPAHSVEDEFSKPVLT